MLGTLYSSFEEQEALAAAQKKLDDKQSGAIKANAKQIVRAGRNAKRGEDGLPIWGKEKKFVLPASPKQADFIFFFHQSALRGQHEIVKDLIFRTHVNPNLRDEKGWTALMRAAKIGATEVVAVLIEGKADLDASSNKKNGPLHKAAKASRVDIVRMLAQANANLDLRNEGSATPLMIAIMYNREEVVEELLKRAAGVNLQKKDTGYSALMLAARQGREHMCAALVRAQAELELVDKQRETALAKAQKRRQTAAANCLIDFGADTPKALEKKGFKPPDRNLERNVTAQASKELSKSAYLD